MSLLLAAASTGMAASDAKVESETLSQLELELDRLQGWQTSVAGAFSVGVESNPILSSKSAEAQGFATGQFEALASKADWEGLTLSAFLDASCTRFPSQDAPLGGRQSWIIFGEAKGSERLPLRPTLSASAYLQDEVLDLSATGTGHWIAPLRVWGGRTVFSLRRNMGTHFWVEAHSSVHRCAYLDYAGDFTEPGLGARLGAQLSGGLEILVDMRALSRLHDSRGMRTIAGRERAGTRLRLRFLEQESRVRWKGTWHGEWRAEMTLRRIACKDGDSGFHDYRQSGASLQAEWEQGRWAFRVEAGGEHYAYDVQTVGMGLAPAARKRTDANGLLRLSRDLGKERSLWLEYRAERSRTNEQDADYTNCIVVVGMRQEF